jgi:hypothetical protein
VKLPVSFVVPPQDQLAANGSDAAAPAPPAPTAGAIPAAAVVSTAGRRGATATPTLARTQLIARLLISPSDTTPLFGVMAGSMAAALGLLALMARKRKQEV